MIVHFIASKTNITKNIDYLRRIVSVIHAQEHMLARDWIEPAFIRQTKEGRRSIDWTSVFQESVEAVAKADVIIAEATYSSFSVGFQIATALQHKKTTLLLRHEDANKDDFVTGVGHACLEHKEYNDKNLEPIVEKFLEDNNIQTKDMRFNFFIDRPIYNYLRWASQKTGQTKAEILRQLVQREIDDQNTRGV